MCNEEQPNHVKRRKHTCTCRSHKIKNNWRTFSEEQLGIEKLWTGTRSRVMENRLSGMKQKQLDPVIWSDNYIMLNKEQLHRVKWTITE